LTVLAALAPNGWAKKKPAYNTPATALGFSCNPFLGEGEELHTGRAVAFRLTKQGLFKNRKAVFNKIRAVRNSQFRKALDKIDPDRSNRHIFKYNDKPA